MSINQWFSKLLVSKRKGLNYFCKNAIFSQYFTVVEQFLLHFVKINKVNIKHTLASLLQIPLQGQILHSLYAFQLEIPFKYLLACRTGVIFCLFQGNRRESEASAKREFRAWGGSLKNPACPHTTVQAVPPSDTPQITSQSQS